MNCKTQDAPAAPIGLSVRFWGVRGSIPSPGPDTASYGGNTCCVEVTAGSERIIFDLGTGVRELGAVTPNPITAHIFVSHYHYDHLQGLPFFKAMYDPRSRFSLRGPTRNGRTVEALLAAHMQQPFFPVTTNAFQAQIEYQAFEAGDRAQIGNACISAIEANHPGGNLTYRVDYHQKSIVYATDTEYGALNDQLIEFAQKSDLLIYDAMYTDDEYAGRHGSSKVNWGHSTWQHAIEIANAAQAAMLVLFHHEPMRNDSAMDAIMEEVKSRRKASIAAKEGRIIRLL